VQSVTTIAARVAPIMATGFALLCGVGQLSAAGSSTPPFERIVARFNTTAPPPYRAFRRLDAGIPGSSKHGWLEAWTEYRPGRGMTFEVVREGGHEYVRTKVLRNLLTNEQELIARGQPLRAALVATNYQFEDGGISDEGLQRVTLKAARKSDGIVNGTLFLAPDDAYVARIEGRLVKSPSFWARDVDVVWKYARLGGHVLPVEMTSNARIRMFGRSTFKMLYDYVSIAGHPTGSRVALRDEQ
jgi:hypothetical protein